MSENAIDLVEAYRLAIEEADAARKAAHEADAVSCAASQRRRQAGIDVALSVACPRCSASAGEDCIMLPGDIGRGRIRHMVRYAAAGVEDLRRWSVTGLRS